MNLLFYGEFEKGYWVKELLEAITPPGTVAFSGYRPSIAGLPGDAAAQPYSHICVDVSPLIDEPEAIVQAMRQTRTVTAVPVIVLAAGFVPASRLYQALAGAGFPVITDAVPGLQKQRLKAVLENPEKAAEETRKNACLEPTGEKETDIASAPAFQTAVSARPVRISVTGACSRIGTTTQAIQIVKYLQMMGHTACYVEMDGSGWVRKLEHTLNGVVYDQADGKCSYAQMELYDNPAQFASFRLGGKYEYVVYDYGLFHPGNTAFFDTDFQVFVGGVSPSELEATTALLRCPCIAGRYLFSFVPKTDEPDILSMMENMAGQTAFCPYTPDPFVFLSSSIPVYAKLLQVNPKTAEKKKSFWKRKGRSD